MFGISFGELLIVGIVGLVVLGPERLPAVARTVGRLVRQVQGYADAFKAELNRELHNAEILQLEKELKAEGRQLREDLSHEVAPALRETADAVDETQDDLMRRWHSGTSLDHTATIPDAAAHAPVTGAAHERVGDEDGAAPDEGHASRTAAADAPASPAAAPAPPRPDTAA